MYTCSYIHRYKYRYKYRYIYLTSKSHCDTYLIHIRNGCLS